MLSEEPAGSCSYVLFFFFIFFLLFSNGVSAQVFQNVPISSPPVPVGSGARALGMGGAFIAVSDNATAASWNPAGLVQLDKAEVSAVGTAFFLRNIVDPSDGDETAGQEKGVDINFLSGAIPFVLWDRRWTFSLSYQHLYKFGNEISLVFVNPSGIMRTQAKVETSGSLAAATASLAVDIAPGLSFGLSVNVWNSLFRQNGWTEKLEGTFTVGRSTFIQKRENKYRNLRGVSANLGLLWELSDNTNVGVVFKMPVGLRGTHERLETINGAADSPFREEIKMRLPASVGFGVSHRFSERLLAAFDYSLTFWRDSFIEDGNGNRFNIVRGEPLSNGKSRSTNHMRLGLEYILHNKTFMWPVCIGVGYDPEPSDGGVRDFYTASLGTGLSFDNVSFDLSYEFRFSSSDRTTYMGLSGTEQLTQQHRISISVVQRF